MTIGSYNQSPYLQYNPYRSLDMKARDENDREEKQAIALSEELAASALPDKPVSSQEAKPRIVEDADETGGMNKDNTNSQYSSARMDLMDLQAAFFGFSSRRAADIQPVAAEMT